MIQLYDIHKTFFKGTEREFCALKGVNLHISKGEFTVLLGANGSGKSTLLNIIAGRLNADQGSVQLEGKHVNNIPEHKRSKWVSRVFQDPLSGTAGDLTILENMRLAFLRTKHKRLTVGCNNKFRNEVKSLVADLNLGLEKKLDQHVGSLSGGQRQALTLLMASVDKSGIILMDEPTSALDPATAQSVLELACNLTAKQGLTTIMVTHNLKDALSVGDRILLMERGSIAKDISGEEKKLLTLNELFTWFS